MSGGQQTVAVHRVKEMTADPVLLPKTQAAQILVVGCDDWAIGEAARQLGRAGRTVHRCSDTAETPFPCNALVPGRGCPLDRHDVDVVLVVRERPHAGPGPGDMGAICGLRDGRPLVMAGMSEASGLGEHATRVPPGGDLTATCDRAVAQASAQSPLWDRDPR